MDVPRQIYISGSQFIRNSAPNGRGGALFVSSTTDVQVTTSKFAANTASQGGGLYLVSQSSVLMQDSELALNLASDSGGAACVSSSSLELVETIVRSNYALLGGGTYLTSNAKLSTTSSTFIKNEARGGQGGASYFDSGSGEYKNTTIANNTARDGAAGFLTAFAEVECDSSHIMHNAAMEDGGAFALAESSTLTTTDTTYRRNQAGGNGGALTLQTAATVLLHGETNVFERNVCDRYGGALYMSNSSYDESSEAGGQFQGNKALLSGGAMYWNWYVVTLCSSSLLSKDLSVLTELIGTTHHTQG